MITTGDELNQYISDNYSHYDKMLVFVHEHIWNNFTKKESLNLLDDNTESDIFENDILYALYDDQSINKINDIKKLWNSISKIENKNFGNIIWKMNYNQN